METNRTMTSHIRNTIALVIAGAIIWTLIIAALLIPTGIATANEYDMPADNTDPTYQEAYDDNRVCFIWVADRGTVAIVDRWDRYNGPYVNWMGTASIGATLCEPWDYHYGSSGWQLEPWMPPHVEDRGETHIAPATSSTSSDEWGDPWPWMSARLWFTPVTS